MASITSRWPGRNDFKPNRGSSDAGSIAVSLIFGNSVQHSQPVAIDNIADLIGSILIFWNVWWSDFLISGEMCIMSTSDWLPAGRKRIQRRTETTGGKPLLRTSSGKIMARHFAFLCCAMYLAASSFAQETKPVSDSAAKTATEDGFIPLFDGKLLANWEGTAYWFRVDERAIVAGRLDEKIPNNFFLSTQREYGDFELRLQVKTVGDGVNAGIQFRTKRIPGSHEVSGYQADVGGVGETSVWGALYDESRRQRMLATPDADLLARIVRPDDWNDYTIRCVGPKIEIFINGEQTVDYTETEPGIDTSGVIAVQIHSGPPSEAWYRNLRIKLL